MFVCLYVCMCTSVFLMPIHTYVYIFTNRYIDLDIYIYIYIYIYICYIYGAIARDIRIDICMRACVDVCVRS